MAMTERPPPNGCAFNPAHDGLFCDCCKMVRPPASGEHCRTVLDCGHKICDTCAISPRITQGFKSKVDCPICRIDAAVTADLQIRIANESMVRLMELSELRSAKIVGDDDPLKEETDGADEDANGGAGPGGGDGDDDEGDDVPTGGAATETYEECVSKVNKVLSSAGYADVRAEVLEVIKRLYPSAH